MMMLLPLASFGMFFLVLWTSPTGKATPDWRKAFLQATVLWGVVLVVITEGLSLLHGLTKGWVALSWAAATVAAIAWAARGSIPRRWAFVRRQRFAPDRGSGLILAGMAVIVASLLVVAWVSPPNNTDSLQYHMSRVVHWAQDASLGHYPTAYEPQLWQPIWAETAILNLRLLWGNDTPAGLVQWFSMLGSLIGVSAIASMLGAGVRGQVTASAFTLSVPIGLLEATSTQNDYVAAFWLVCLAYFVLLAARSDRSLTALLAFGGALGIGILTKGTFYPYALPFVLWYLMAGWFHRGWRRILVEGASIAAITVLLNAGYWWRNIVTYGGPLGPAQTVGFYTGIDRTPSAMVVALAGNVALNLALPGEILNRQIIAGVEGLARALHTSSEGFQLTSLWNFEDLAGNPLHLLLVPVSLILLWMRRAIIRGQDAGWYALAGLASFASMAAVVFLSPWGVRFQTSFFVIWGPVFGLAIESAGRRLVLVGAAALVLVSLPWVVFNRTRPMIGWRPRTSTDSIFRTPASESLFANWIERREPSIAAAADVEATGCKQVGLRLDSHDWEYSFWWLLQAPQSGIRLEVLNPPPNLQRYVDPTFRPCVVICTICGERPRIYGLDLKVAYSDVRVYAGDGFVPDVGE